MGRAPATRSWAAPARPSPGAHHPSRAIAAVLSCAAWLGVAPAIQLSCKHIQPLTQHIGPGKEDHPLDATGFAAQGPVVGNVLIAEVK